ncbi:MAG: glycerophosphodiester phosphodiesterase family protein [Calditrichia bacterium]
MKAFLKFSYYNHHRNARDYIRNGIGVQICRSINRDVNFDVLARSRLCDDSGLFAFQDVPLQRESDIFFRVGFLKRNLDLRDGLLYSPDENHKIPARFARYPVPLITWSSLETKADHGEAGFFHGIRNQSLGSEAAPLTFLILFRPLFIFGHRGAPHEFPENSADSFSRAIELGANALEMDLCMSADHEIVVLHDPDPFVTPMRNLAERLPYPLVSPEIEFADGVHQWRSIVDEVQGTYSNWKLLDARQQLNALKLVFPEVQRLFAYRHPRKRFVHPPLLKEILNNLEIHSNSHILFFLDLKIEENLLLEETGALSVFAGKLYEILKNPDAPGWEFILGCPHKTAVKQIAENFQQWGQLTNCEFNPEGQIRCVIYWTVDNPQDMYEIIQEGIDGILTNKPEVAMDVLRRLKVQI